MGRPLSRPRQPFWVPLVAILDFLGSHRRNARIKKLILQKLTGAPKNLGIDHYTDPGGHFGSPWRPFWIFEVLIEGMM